MNLRNVTSDDAVSVAFTVEPIVAHTAG